MGEGGGKERGKERGTERVSGDRRRGQSFPFFPAFFASLLPPHSRLQHRLRRFCAGDLFRSFVRSCFVRSSTIMDKFVDILKIFHCFIFNRVRQRFGSTSSSQVNRTDQQDMLVVRSLLDQNGVRWFTLAFEKNRMLLCLRVRLVPSRFSVDKMKRIQMVHFPSP